MLQTEPRPGSGGPDAGWASYRRTGRLHHYLRPRTVLLASLPIAAAILAGVWLQSGWRLSLVQSRPGEAVSVDAFGTAEQDASVRAPQARDRRVVPIERMPILQAEKEAGSQIAVKTAQRGRPLPRPATDPAPLPGLDDRRGLAIEADVAGGPLPVESVRPERPQPVARERLDGSQFDLQAVAWSRDPEKRVAVINGRVLREGSSVEGLRIEKIEEDRVIFRKGNSSFELVLRLE